MPTSWFVKTRGSRADEDYTWCPVTAADPDDPGEISERGWRGHPCFSLLDDEQPGMLLFDDEKTGTVLLVTGLISPERPSDYQRRAIRVSLLGVATHHEPDQRSLVAVAVRALRDGLIAHLPVSYGIEGGFAVEEARWSHFIELATGELSDVTDVRPDPEKIKLRRDTEEGRRKTANELSALYLRAGPDALTGKLTILRTNVLDAPDIGRLKPWRTISDSDVADAPAQAFVSGANPISEVRANAGKLLGTLIEEIGRHRILLAALALAGIAAVTAVVLSLGGSPSPAAPNTSGWRIADVIDSPVGNSQLKSVVALGPHEALGVGLSCGPGCPKLGQQLLVVLWNGTAWTQLPLPPGLVGTPENLAVGASSATNAWIFDSTSSPHSYALRWDGRNWTVIELPASSAFYAAAVFSPADVWAFGKLPDERPYNLHYDGQRWSIVTLPAVPSGVLNALSPDDIWATATAPASRSQAGPMPVLLHWDGQSWQSINLPGTPPGGGLLAPSSIAALSSSDVWVTGTATASHDTFLLHWDGTTWRMAQLPNPGQGPGKLAQDGAGGLWLTASAAGLPGYFYHYSKGRWIGQPAPEKKGYATLLSGLSWIPGTTSLWAHGVLDPTSPNAGRPVVIFKYGG